MSNTRQPLTVGLQVCITAPFQNTKKKSIKSYSLVLDYIPHLQTKDLHLSSIII